MLSSTIHKLLHFFLAVITSSMRFNKTFHRVCSRPRIIAYKIKMLSVKYIYKNHLINNGCNKKIPIIRFACETNRMVPLVCMVTEP